ncbi:24059_t:CDS:1, partial [Racocetra persica]
SVNEASSSWSDDFATEDTKFQEQHDKFTNRILKTRDLKDPTQTLPITGEFSVQEQGIIMHNIEALKILKLPTVQAWNS